LSSETLFRTSADNNPIELNRNLSANEKRFRIDQYYKPYHNALALIVNRPLAVKYSLILSLHSFTPLYEGTKRDVEIGSLYSVASGSKELAYLVSRHFQSKGFDSRINEPWSGLDGFMYAAESGAQPPHRPALMIEFRNDLLQNPEVRNVLVSELVVLLDRFGSYSSYS